MSPIPRLCLVLALAGLVQGCQVGLPGGGAGQDAGVTENAVAGDPIEVTALDDPAAPAPAVAAAPLGGTAPASDTPAVESVAAPDAVPADPAAAEPVPAEPAEVEVPPEAEAVPEVQKSAARLECERRKGRWTLVGDGPFATCVFFTRDGGKQCDRESDCEEACLARSRTCSPIRPLLGCNDILQDNGVRVTQCIE